MELLSRYLQAVRFWLPKDRQNDIVAELSDDLLAQIEDRQESLGRPLNDTEVEEIIKRFGHPMVVADRFQTGSSRTLIGPELFPIYRLLLKGFWLFYLLPWLVVWIVLVCTPSFRSAHPGIEFLKTLSPWYHLALNSFAGLTIGFAVIERMQPKLKWFEKWNPRSLPPAFDPNRIPRVNSFFELMSDIAAAAIWISLPQYPAPLAQPSASAVWNPGAVWYTVHHTLFVPILVLTLAGAVVSGTNLFRPFWTRNRLAFRATLMGLGTALAGVVLAMHGSDFHAKCLKLSSDAALSDVETQSYGIDAAIYVGVISTALICLCSCAWYAYKAWRYKAVD